MAEISLSVRNLKQAMSGSYESDKTLGLSTQKCEDGTGLCSEEFKERQAEMSIMEWPRQGQGNDNVTRKELQLSVNNLGGCEGVLLKTPSVQTSRASSMSSVSWGDTGYESPTQDPNHREPVNLHHQKSQGQWTSLIQNMGRSKKEKQLRRTAEKITIQVEPPGDNEEYNMGTLSNRTAQVCSTVVRIIKDQQTWNIDFCFNSSVECIWSLQVLVLIHVVTDQNFQARTLLSS